MESVPRKRKGRDRGVLELGVVAIIVILLLGGLGYLLYVESGEPQIVLNWYSELSAVSLDPAAVLDPGSQVPLHNIYETLVTYEGEETSEVSPCLATTWYVSTNGVWYNFTLREGVVFSNGNSFEAGDVKFSLERAINMYNQAGGSGGDLAEYVDLERTQALDTYTISVKLKVPFSGFLAVLAQPRPLSIVDREYTIERYSAADMFAHQFLSMNPMGTGPYELKSWDKGDKLVLVQNHAYWRGWNNEQVDQVVIYEGRGTAAKIEALSSGSADIVDIPLSNASAFSGVPDVYLGRSRGLSLQTIVMNVNTSRPSHAFMTDAGVRRAFAYAFDYGNVSDRSYFGYLEQVNGCIPLGFPLEGESQPSKGFSYNLTMASELLNASGYPLDFTGHRFGGVNLGLLLNRSNPSLESVAEAYKEDLERIGVSVLLVNETIRTIRVTRSWDMHIVEFIPRYIDPIDPVNSIAVSEANGGDAFYSGIDNPYIDAEASAGASTSSPEMRASSYGEIWASLNTAPNSVFIGQTSRVHCHSAWIQGFVVNPVLQYSFYLYSGTG